MDPLACFHPAVAAWFRATLGAPTAVQCAAWPAIAAGEHVLATAPTGSGKTLAAFLWALDRLATGAWEPGTVRALYISPLKALNSDVRRNLLTPLAGIAEAFRAHGAAMPPLHAEVRSGDTTPSERQRQIRRPPEILATTPESLNLLLSSAGGRRMLGGVRTVILDEVHALAGDKRGAWLMTGLERLVLLSGDVQRVALSATVHPLDLVAEWVGGSDAQGKPRPVRVLRAPGDKRYDLRVHATPQADPIPGDDTFWSAFARELRTVIAANRSTLIFTNARRLSEKLARFLNEGLPEPIAWAHHGSLSRELRALVEDRLKRGELKALVATGSLELGIDVGALDQVVLVQTPMAINACIQRLGRAGHQVGAVSRGRLYPTHGRDLLAAAAVAPLAVAGRGEAVRPVRAPLDVLAQSIVAMVGIEDWDEDALFAVVRRAWPFRTLGRAAFDLVVGMLAGRYAEARIRELTPRLRREDGRLRAAPGALALLYASGGMIPDRGYFALRVQGGGAKLGELDEEFVWERHVGDDIVIGAQTWRIATIGDQAVEVVASAKSGGIAPFWRADGDDRGHALHDAAGELVARIEPRLDDPGLPADLEREQLLEPEAARRLIAWLQRQRAATGVLPHARRVVAERCPDPAHGEDDPLVLHAPWGGRVLRPWAIALGEGWRRAHGSELKIAVGDDCLLAPLPPGIGAREFLALAPPERLDALLRAGLGRTGFFGARFRECAGRALLLPRGRARQRTPLWLTRQKAKRLLQAVAAYDDFPIVAETWRTCLEDSFELDALRQRLDAIADGSIPVHEVRTMAASPFAEGVMRSTTNSLMYATDAPAGAGAGPLSERVLAQVLHDSDLRPRIAPAVAGTLAGKLARTAPGYAPRDADELVELVRDRVLLPADEWDALLTACARDQGREVATIAAEVATRIRPTTLPGGLPALAVPTQARRARAALADDEALRQCLAEHLRAYAPLPPARIAAVWGLDAERLAGLLAALVDAGTMVVDHLLADDERTLVCDAENLERLLRLGRAARRVTVAALPLARLPWLLARWQGLAPRGRGPEALATALARLTGFVAPAALWETDLLGARVDAYLSAQLDALLAGGALRWFGHGRAKLGFAPPEDLPLHARGAGDEALALLPDRDGRYDLLALIRRSGLASAEVGERLWRLAWRGEVANDGFAAVRAGLAADFTAPAVPDLGRHGRAAWQATRPMAGAWYGLPTSDAGDAVDHAQRNRERARLVLDRYGVVFRELLAHEPPHLQWGALVPALRLLELGGEAIGGNFIAGPAGLQFALPGAIAALGEAAGDDTTPWWCNALDPASGCGLGLDLDLPPRVAATRLVWAGSRLALVVRRSGSDLEVRLPAGDGALAGCLALLADWVRRAEPVLPRLAVERIDGVVATASPWRAALEAVGFSGEYRSLVVRRTFI